MGVDIIRFQGESPAEAGGSLVHFALSLEGYAKIIVRLDKTRLQGEQSLICGDRLFDSALGQENKPQVRIGLGVIGAAADGLADQFHGNFVPSHLMGQRAQ